MAVDTKQPYAVISRFEHLFKEKFGKKPELNKFKEKWAALDLIDSFGYARVMLALDYYFEVGTVLSWSYFSRNCDKILQTYDVKRQDEINREELRAQAKVWLDESRSQGIIGSP